MLPAMRVYGLMIFIAALIITPFLQQWTGQATAVLLITLPFALFSAIQYRRAGCTRDDWQAVRRHPDLWLTIMGKAVFWGIILVLLAIYAIIMKWLPILINYAFMLFLTVGSIPALHNDTTLWAMACAVIVPAAYTGALVFGGMKLAARSARSAG